MAHTITISIEGGTLGMRFEYDQITLNVDDSNEGTWRLLEMAHTSATEWRKRRLYLHLGWGLGYGISFGDTVTGEDGPG